MFELLSALKLATIGHHSRGINERVFAFATLHSFARPPLTDGIVLVKCQSQWIDLAMARRAACVRSVCFNSIANCYLSAFGRNRIDRVDVGWRRWRCLIEDRFADPNTAMYGTMTGAVRS